MPLLKKTPGSRVVTLSSVTHSLGNIDFTDLNWEKRKYKTLRAYGDSKLANLYFTYELARKLKSNNNHPKIIAAHPGWTTTDLQRHSGILRFFNHFLGQSIEMGALPILRAGFDDTAESGEYYGPSRFRHMHGPPKKQQSNNLSYNEDNAKKLWGLSEKMTGVKY